MKITLAAIAPRRTRSKSEATDRLLADYIERAARYVPCDAQLFDSEAEVLEWLPRRPPIPHRPLIRFGSVAPLSSYNARERSGKFEFGREPLAGPGVTLYRLSRPWRTFTECHSIQPPDVLFSKPRLLRHPRLLYAAATSCPNRPKPMRASISFQASRSPRSLLRSTRTSLSTSVASSMTASGLAKIRRSLMSMAYVRRSLTRCARSKHRFCAGLGVVSPIAMIGVTALAPRQNAPRALDFGVSRIRTSMGCTSSCIPVAR